MELYKKKKKKSAARISAVIEVQNMYICMGLLYVDIFTETRIKHTVAENICNQSRYYRNHQFFLLKIKSLKKNNYLAYIKNKNFYSK